MKCRYLSIGLFTAAIVMMACSPNDFPDVVKDKIAQATVDPRWRTDYERRVPCDLPSDSEIANLRPEAGRKTCGTAIRNLMGSWKRLEFSDINPEDTGTFICQSAQIGFEANRDRLLLNCSQQGERDQELRLPFDSLQFRGYWQLGDVCLFETVVGDESMVMGFITKLKKSDVNPHLVGCYEYHQDLSGDQGGINSLYRGGDILLF